MLVLRSVPLGAACLLYAALLGAAPVSEPSPMAAAPLRAALHTVWQARRMRPWMRTRHSWHTPMPHSGARGSPATEVRVVPGGCCASAAATLMPAGTWRGIPFTTICTVWVWEAERFMQHPTNQNAARRRAWGRWAGCCR